MNVEDLPVAVLILDADRIIVSANDAIETVCGFVPKELIGRSVADALHPRTIDGVDLMVGGWHRSTVLSTVRRCAEHDVVVHDSAGRPVDVVVDGGYTRDGAGAVSGATLLLRRRSRGVRRPRSGVRVVAAVSHELRSPLTSVRGYTTLLLKRWEEIDDDERKTMLLQIDRDARRVGRMISELLDAARLESGRLQLQRVALDVRAACERAIITVSAGYPDMAVHIDAPSGGVMAWADADKFEQVLVNLLENACKYASPNGIEIGLRADGELVTVAVTDAGVGMTETEFPSLFQQFSRRADGRPSGTGLGLWISRGLVEAHGGQMSVERAAAGGTTFRFTLPQFEPSRHFR